MVLTDLLKAWEAKLQTPPCRLRSIGGTPGRKFKTKDKWDELRARLREPKPWVLASEVTRTAPQGEDLDCAVHAINNSLQLSGEDGITNAMVQDISQQQQTSHTRGIAFASMTNSCRPSLDHSQGLIAVDLGVIWSQCSL